MMRGRRNAREPEKKSGFQHIVDGDIVGEDGDISGLLFFGGLFGCLIVLLGFGMFLLVAFVVAAWRIAS